MYRWIEQNNEGWSITKICNTLQIHRKGYYRYLKSKTRETKESAILPILLKLRKQHPAFGVERLRRILPAEHRASYGTIYRICKKHGLLQKSRRPRGITRQNPLDQASEDLIHRDFSAAEPDKKWLSDITQFSCKDGALYIAAILDCFDGALVGLSINTHKRAELCTNALQDAIGRYGKADGLILHSDRGSQYTSHAFRAMLKKQAILQSMGRTGSCYDNARMESFFATLKKELIYRLPLSTLTKEQVRKMVFEWIHFYYNRERLTSVNDNYMPPLLKRSLYYRAVHNIAA